MSTPVDPFARITPGLTGHHQLVVTPELTVGHHAAGMPLVYGTPFMILAMEIAAGDALRGRLPEGWVSVGVDVNIRHLRATPVGRTVTTTGRVTHCDGKLVHFEIEAHDGVALIGRGTHTRAPVEVARFLRPMG
jgi:predicted thioesterase